MNDSRPTPYAPETLPAPIRRYLESPRDAALADSVFTPEATVTDEGVTRVGSEAIREWLANAASAYAYTTEYTEQAQHSPTEWTVKAHLQGDFPGGEADLRFRFRLDGDWVAELLIAP